MTCAEVRAMAESYLAGELPVDSSHDIITHLERCAGCRAELDSRMALRQTLKRAFLQSEKLAPSPEFSARVRESLRTDAGSGPWFRRLTPWMAIAASIVLVLLLGRYVLPRSEQPGPSSWLAALAGHAAGDHRNCALNHSVEEFPLTLDEAARRYDRAYGQLREIVAQSDPVRRRHIEVLAAHWCVFRGRPFAHLVVQLEGRVASILLTPMTGARVTNTAAKACPHSDGFQVACFEARGHGGFVVSDLTAEQNLQLARDLAPILRAHLARG